MWKLLSLPAPRASAPRSRIPSHSPATLLKWCQRCFETPDDQSCERNANVPGHGCVSGHRARSSSGGFQRSDLGQLAFQKVSLSLSHSGWKHFSSVVFLEDPGSRLRLYESGTKKFDCNVFLSIITLKKYHALNSWDTCVVKSHLVAGKSTRFVLKRC